MHEISVTQRMSARIGTTAVSLGEAEALRQVAIRNKAKVLESALTLEDQLAELIALDFFPEDGERRVYFKEIVLDSDWCTFANKRKLIEWIIRRRSLLSGSDFSQYQNLLARTMKYRNAFAHGTLTPDLSTEDWTVWLTYFQGGRREQELSDDYLLEIERTLNDAWRMTWELAQAMGYVKVGSNR